MKDPKKMVEFLNVRDKIDLFNILWICHMAT
jgi:hypothetical protein